MSALKKSQIILSVMEPFTSPAWGSNFAVFSSEYGAPVPEEETKEYINRACRYARHYQVYLVPERFMLMGYQCMCLISPEGKVLGAQKAAYWNLKHRVVGKRSTNLEVLQTEFGGIFLCVDVDIYRPEITRAAQGMGAQIVICSQHIYRGDYGTPQVLSGCWNAAQSNNLYVVVSCNQFNCLCAPCSITSHNDGFVVSPNLKMPLTATFSADDLELCRSRSPINRKFYAVHRNDLLL